MPVEGAMSAAESTGRPREALTGREALAGVRVVELGEGRAVAYAGKLLAEFGADVVKVEAPGGDPLRRRIPLAEAPEADGALHRWLQANKRSVVVDWRREVGALQPLLDGADVVISAAPVIGPEAPATARALEPAALREGRRQLVVGYVSDFGPEGPLAEWMGGELVLYALSGLLGACGPYERPPLKHGVGVAWYTSGAALALGVLVALWEREGQAEGQVVDVAGLDCMVAAQGGLPVQHGFTGVVPRRFPKAPRADRTILPCRDGHVAVMVGRDRWPELVELLGEPRLAEERFQDASQRGAHMAELVELLLRRLRERSKREWLEAAQALRVAFAPAQSAGEVAECPQLEDRGFFVVAQGADGRHTRMPGRPFLMSGSPWRLRRPAPLLGDTSLEEVGWEPRPEPSGEPPSPALPLRGVRVVELGTAYAGPFATKILADLGADVIKVESHSHPDNVRVDPYSDGELGERFFDELPRYLVANTSKYHVCLELSDPTARALLRRLVRGADVLVENYRPHVMERFGMSHEELRREQPELIMLSTTGYGHSGPWRDYVAYGWSLEPAAGLSDVTGYADGPPTGGAVPYPDLAAAVHAAYAVLLALWWRRGKGEGQGQWIDLAQYETSVGATVAPLLQYLARGEAWGRHGNRHPWYAPHNLYAAAPDGTELGVNDQWVAIAVESDREWRRLVQALGEALPARPEWERLAGRKADEDRIDTLIGEWTGGRTAAAAARYLQAAGVRAAPVLRFDQVARQRQLWERGALVRAVGREVGPRIVPGPWQRFSRRPGGVRWAAANFGEHNRLVLQGVLGLSEAELQALYASGGTADAPAMPRPASAGLSLETQVELGIARGAAPAYQEWNRAGPTVPLAENPPLDWPASKEGHDG